MNFEHEIRTSMIWSSRVHSMHRSSAARHPRMMFATFISRFSIASVSTRREHGSRTPYPPDRACAQMERLVLNRQTVQPLLNDIQQAAGCGRRLQQRRTPMLRGPA